MLHRAEPAPDTPILRFLARVADTLSNCASLTIVGSSACESREFDKTLGDFDIIALHDGDADALSEQLTERLLQDFPDWRVAATWDLVSPQSIGGRVIHLHVASITEYAEVSALFRRSVGKYHPLFGSPLADFAPRGPRTANEFLNDSLGPNRFIATLKDGTYPRLPLREVGLPHRARELERYADPLDFALYAALQSSRNALRVLGRYTEHSRFDELPQLWEESDAPNIGALRSVVSAKIARRSGEIVSASGFESLALTTTNFLKGLVAWAEGWRPV
jgi:hypothetical protein